MALSAGRLDKARRQNWLLPGKSAAVSLFHGGSSTLSAMTHHAAKLVRRMWDYRMAAERLRADIGKARFFQSHVTSSAAIDDSELQKPYLLDSVMEVTLQRDRVTARANQRQVLFLKVTP